MADTTLKITADTSQAERSLSKLNAAFEGLKSAIAGVGFGALITSSLRLADTIQDLSDATGIGTDKILGFGDALAANGGNADKAEKGILKLVQTIGEAADGSAAAQNLFKDLGVTLDDLKKLSEEEILKKTIEGLDKITNSSERSAKIAKVLGKEFRGVKFGELANAYSAAANANDRYAGSIAAGAGAQQAIELSIRRLQIALLDVLRPITEFVSNINISVDAISKFLKFAGNLVAVFLLLGPGISLINKLGNGVAAAGGAFLALNKVVLGVFAGFNGFINNLLRMVGVLPSAYSGVQSLGFALVALSRGLLRFAGLAGLVYAVVDAFSELEKSIFNTNYIEKGIEKTAIGLEHIVRVAGQILNMPTNLIGRMLGIDNPAGLGDPLVALANKAEAARKSVENAAGAGRGGNPELTRMLQERGEKLAQESALEREVIDALALKRKAIENIGIAYKKQNNDILDNINFEKGLVGKTEDYIEVERAREAVLKKAADETEKLRQAKALLTKDEQGLSAVYDAQIALIAKNATADADRIANATAGLLGLRMIEQGRIQDLENTARLIEDNNNRQISLGKQILDINQKISDVKFEGDIAGLTPLQKQIAQIREDNRKGALEAGRAFAAQFDGMDLTTAQAAELANGLSQIAARYKVVSDTQVDNMMKTRTWNAGWKSAFDDYVENATNAAMAAQNIFKVATQSMEDALVGLAKTGKFAWKDMLATMAEDLLRSQIRQLFASMMGGKSSGGSVILGALSSLGSILGFRATGGPISAGNPYVVGERGPELVIPSSSGTVIPNSALGGGNVTYNINAVDALSFKQMIAKDPSFIHAVATQGGKSIPGTRR